jgi:hypothetical protein
LLLLLLVITFLPPPCHSLLLHDTPRRQSSNRTSNRTNERTNERTVTLPFSRHLSLTITNFLPLASSLPLLTLNQLRRCRRR